MINLREVHAKIAEIARQGESLDVTAGVDEDDCAVVNLHGRTTVITTDFINSSPAMLELGDGSWRDLGHLVACHNLADLAGSGCMPLHFLTGICVTPNTSEAEILEFVEGVCTVCSRYGCSLVGGDTKIGSKRSVYGTVIGVPFGLCGPFLRSNAKSGDILVVSNPIGAFAAAVVALSLRDKAFNSAEVDEAKAVLLRAEVNFSLPRILASHCLRCAGTDLSDGLGTDLLDLCRSSNTRAVINEQLIPVDNFTSMVASRMGFHGWAFSFASGGDFACVYAIPPDCLSLIDGSEGIVIGRLEEGHPELRSVNTGKLLATSGHHAARQVSFADEILANLREIQDAYGN